MPSPAALRVVDASAVRAWVAAGRDALAAARDEIDELNVYPVPDGDTGTNLHLTVEAAALALGDLTDDASLAETLAAAASGALLGARGNSGVILSQVLHGLAAAARQPLASFDPAAWATALQGGSEAAYAAVGQPVEGTMLTVLRAAATAASQAAAGSRELVDVVRSAADEAHEALARTPEQLEVLRLAGVVDAGGRGVCVLLDSLVGVVAGDDRSPTRAPDARTPARPAALHHEPAEGGAHYEVMYLLEAPAAAIAPLRATLAELGESLVVVGDEPTWNVHVHVDDAGAAVEAGVVAGRPHRIRVTNLHDAVRTGPASAATGAAVVAVVAGTGLAALFEASGATVVPGGPGRRASTGEILAGIRATGSADVVVLPNDADSLAVAEAAAVQARAEGRKVAVLSIRASVQAIAALAVHDASRRPDDDVLAMTAAAGHCRHGAVTVASRQAVTMAGVCQVGDVLGIVDGDFAVIGSDLGEVACTVVDRMLGSGGELVTIVTGEGTPLELARAVAAHVHDRRPEVDTVTLEGGQPRYPLLIGVE